MSSMETLRLSPAATGTIAASDPDSTTSPAFNGSFSSPNVRIGPLQQLLACRAYATAGNHYDTLCVREILGNPRERRHRCTACRLGQKAMLFEQGHAALNRFSVGHEAVPDRMFLSERHDACGYLVGAKRCGHGL